VNRLLLLPLPLLPPRSLLGKKITLAADALFDFNKATLRPEGKAKLDDVVAKSNSLVLEVVIAVGHADRIGGDAYNQKLSEKARRCCQGLCCCQGHPGQPCLHRRQRRKAARHEARSVQGSEERQGHRLFAT